jgi:hypothetical protein
MGDSEPAHAAPTVNTRHNTVRCTLLRRSDVKFMGHLDCATQGRRIQHDWSLNFVTDQLCRRWDNTSCIMIPTSYAREFAVFVEAGIPPMDAIQAGTRVAAELLRWDDRLGTLERGKRVKRPGEQPSLAGLLPSPSGR